MARVTMAVFAIASLAAEAAVADDGGPPTAEPTAPPVAEPLLPPVTESAPEASSEPVPLRWIDRVTLSGGVDGYVALPLRGGLREPSALRAFDAVNGSFTLAYAELAVAVAPAPAGLRLDLGFGPVADLSSLEVTTDPGPPPTTTTGASEVMKHVQQAYVSLELPGPRSVVVDAGRFVTSAGAEVIEAKDDWLYSRSLLFGYAIPFAHNGVRITAAMSARLSLQAMLVNGWDVAADPNDAKTIGASVLYARSPTGLAAAVNVLAGKETAAVRVLVDIVIGTRATRGLAWNLNLDAGRDGDAAWYGASAMVRHVGRRVTLVARVEHFEDPGGVRTGVAGGTAISETTAGIAIPIGGAAEVRLEGRVDQAAATLFAGGTESTQATVTAAALAWF